MKRQFKAELLVTVELPDDTANLELKQQFINGTSADVAKVIPLLFPVAPQGFVQLSAEVTSIAEVFQAGRDNHKHDSFPKIGH
jgi:hypothetical protein